ncbi:MAG TPA: HEAT repeat domain-containing protein [Candidatus Eisenbacteria bacterium]|jgi:hypothetical protein
MTTSAANPQARYPALRDLSPAAQSAALWFRQLGRALKTCRLYRRENPIVVRIRAQLLEQLEQALRTHGAWTLRIQASEIFLGNEPVVFPRPRSHEDAQPSAAEQLPFVFYRDGIRGLTLLPEVPQHDFDALFDALLAAGGGLLTHDDLVTLLWQANTTKVQIETVPISQTIYLSSRRGTGRGGGGGGHPGQTYAWSPTGSEIRADIGQVTGVAQGLHRDTFDDWPLPVQPADVVSAYDSLARGMQFVRTMLRAEWSAEAALEWNHQVPTLFARMLALDGSVETRGILAQSVVTWLVAAIQRSSWSEAQQALTLLREVDPDGSLGDESLGAAMSALDARDVTERLDESEAIDQFKFTGIMVAIGRPALELACAVMAKATKSRTRAAACTMLCYLCGEDPQLLAPYLTDSRWFVVRNVVFVLGQIGGPEVVDLLATAAAHPDPRVRRQVVTSLGDVPHDARLPILLGQLDSRDPRLLAGTLNTLMRCKDPEVTRAILKQIEAPEFESRSEDNQRALIGALGEVADDDAVSTLEALLHKGGWFARRTIQRTAAAHTLQRLGTPRALAALEAGLRSRSEAVRAACLDAVSRKAAP